MNVKYTSKAVGVVGWDCGEGFPEAVRSEQVFTGRQGGIVGRGPGCVKPRAAKGLGLLGNWAWCKVAGLGGGAGSTMGGVKLGKVGSQAPEGLPSTHRALGLPFGREDPLGGLTKEGHGHGLEDEGGLWPDWWQEIQVA